MVLDPRLAADPVYGVSSLSLAMVTISSGYFLYDLGCCVTRLHVEGTAFLVHALCCLFVYGYAVFFGTLHWFGERREPSLQHAVATCRGACCLVAPNRVRVLCAQRPVPRSPVHAAGGSLEARGRLDAH